MLVVETHQQRFAVALARSGALVKLGRFAEAGLRDTVRRALRSERSRRAMSRRGRALADGEGNRPVLQAMDFAARTR